MAGAHRHLRRSVRALAVRFSRYDVAAAGVALLAALAVAAVSIELFPYHSLNHDEGVYLRQAGLLLEGRLDARPPAPESFRPWFFVEDGDRLYSKYAPVPAALFALGKLLAGSYRAALVGVAAANVGLCYLVVREAFDARTGVLACALYAASPLFVVGSATFLPYAPTAALNLLFALAYFRAARTGSVGYAGLAGAAAGLAFFARPYTAVLFAAPFAVHALAELRSLDRGAVVRHGVTAAVGLAGVAVALGYNALMTGSPAVFPYEAFAPLDGLGFGHRRLGAYDRHYTPALALRANAEVVATLFGEWVAGGALGALLAAAGLVAVLRRGRDVRPERLVLAGLFVSVVAGNVYFWGNLNVLGSLADPRDGLIRFLGPYYHFDLLLPTAAFGAYAALAGVDRLRTAAARLGDGRARPAFLAALLVGAAAFGAANAAALAGPVRDNAAVTDQYERAYTPFEGRELDGAVVFLPTPYGPWLGHPFQALRNDPGFDGPTVYAVDRGPANLHVASTYPDRTLYRYAFRGEWTPLAGPEARPHFQRVRVVEGERVTTTLELGVPRGVDRVSLRLGNGDDAAYYAVNVTARTSRETGASEMAGPPDRATVRVVVADGRARLDGPGVEPAGGAAGVPVNGSEELVAEAFVDAGRGGFSYVAHLPVTADGTVRAMTPYVEVCRGVGTCGGEAAYVPGAHRPGVFVNATLTTGNATDASAKNASVGSAAKPTSAHR